METFKKTFRILLITLIFPALMWANKPEVHEKNPFRYEKERVVKKNFKVNADALMKIDNAYGNLTISNWNENRIEMIITIKAEGSDEDRVIEKIEGVDIDFMSSSSMVSAKTIFNNKRSGWSWNWGNSNVNLSVHYTIKMPISNSVDLENDYGSIIIDQINGNTKINCDYGRLEIGSLNGDRNDLKFDYTSKSTIAYVKKAYIEADYSGMTIEKAGDLNINSDYSSISIFQMDNLSYDADYGSIEVEEANDVNGVGDYFSTKLGVLHGNVTIDADYGSVKIAEMALDAGSLYISSDYTGIKIGYHMDYNFTFEIETKYAGVSGTDAFEMSISKEKSSERYYKGYYKNPNSKNHIQILSKYGGLSFTRK